MDRTLVEFVKVLRNADLKVSPAETLDAMHALDIVGYDDREFLKNTLSIVLSKNPEEKEAFDSCFDRFFTFDKFSASADGEASAWDQAGDAGGDGEGAEGEGAEGPEGEGREGAGGGRGGGRRRRRRSGEEEERPEFDDDSLEPQSPLGKLVVAENRTEITIAIAEAGRAVNVHEILVFTQKGLYTRKIMDYMGLAELQEEVQELRRLGGNRQMNLAERLRKGRDALREQVRDYVERQFFLHADEEGKQLREELLKKVKLSNLEKRNFKDVQDIVLKMSKKLVSIHSKRRKTFKRGQLDVRRTLRNNMQFDGMLFNIKWKASRVDRPKVMAICDVSGSVSNYSRFLLMFLYSLAEILPKVRSFAFSSDLGEVTDLFEYEDLEDAMAMTLRDYGAGSTDYGQMLIDFKKNCLNDVNKKTTIIILGDARNNYGDPQTEILREMYDKSQRLIWLNPEARSNWTIGDAEMKKYAPCCHQVEVCNCLQHLERVVSNLLRSVN